LDAQSILGDGATGINDRIIRRLVEVDGGKT
jgi:hypothetical protein